MGLFPMDVVLMRLVKQATALAFVVAQDYRTRDIMLFAPTGEVLVHDDVLEVRAWLRHYAECGRFGRRCFVDGQHTCSGIPAFANSLLTVFEQDTDCCVSA